MELYYVDRNAQTNGDHAVHKSVCSYLPADRTYLGQFARCHEAVHEAKK